MKVKKKVLFVGFDNSVNMSDFNDASKREHFFWCDQGETLESYIQENSKKIGMVIFKDSGLCGVTRTSIHNVESVLDFVHGKRIPAMLLSNRVGSDFINKCHNSDLGMVLDEDVTLKSLGSIVRKMFKLYKKDGVKSLNIEKIESLVLYPELNVCLYNNRVIDFRNREFEIFRELFKHNKTALTHEEITNNICVSVRESTKEVGKRSNVVGVHVKAIRDKLAEFGLDKVIVSVRGVGYMFDSSLIENMASISEMNSTPTNPDESNSDPVPEQELETVKEPEPENIHEDQGVENESPDCYPNEFER